MGRKFWLSIILIMATLGFGVPLCVQAEDDDGPIMHKHEQRESDHHKEIRKKIKEFEERGYKQENIRKAILIAKHAGVEPQKVLDTYHMTNSWSATAESFGVDFEKIKQHHKEQTQQFFKQNKDQILQELSNYTGSEASELAGYLGDKVSLRTLMKASVMAKLSETELDQIIAAKRSGKSWEDIKDERSIDHEAFKKEMRGLFQRVMHK